MPPGNLGGVARPRLTKVQWHEVGVDLVNGKSKKTVRDKFGISKNTLKRGMKRFTGCQRFHGKPGPPKGRGGAPRATTAAQDANVAPLTEQHQADPYDYTAQDLAEDVGAPEGARGAWSRTVRGTTYHYPARHLSVRGWNRRFERLGLKAYRPRDKEFYDAEDLAKRVAHSASTSRAFCKKAACPRCYLSGCTCQCRTCR